MTNPKLRAAVQAAVRELSFAHHMERFEAAILKHVEPVVTEQLGAAFRAGIAEGERAIHEQAESGQ